MSGTLTSVPNVLGSRKGFYWLLLLPAVVFFGLFAIWPIGQIAFLSFSDPKPGFGNYLRLFADGGIHKLIWTTVRVSIVTTVVSIFLAYVLAYAIVHARSAQARLLIACTLIPFWLSVVVQAFSWILLLRANGLVNTLLINAGIIDAPLIMMRNEFGVMVGMVHFLVPVGVMILIGNLRLIDARLTLAAKSLGASPFQAFRMIYLPLSLPGTAGATVVVFILALGFFVTPALLGGGKTVMLAEYVSLQVLTVARWGVASMLSVVLIAAVSMLLIAMSRVIDLKKALFPEQNA
ncbi:ABC transporter permease [Mesorhizobium kowhaii]|uniref:ABC transporter permease n=1 Tax=Mesorhizobium kowhaii TaxID=1300272 RepID=UPI0035E492B2